MIAHEMITDEMNADGMIVRAMDNVSPVPNDRNSGNLCRIQTGPHSRSMRNMQPRPTGKNLTAGGLNPVRNRLRDRSEVLRVPKIVRAINAGATAPAAIVPATTAPAEIAATTELNEKNLQHL
jgi:hypothetical protein